LTLPADYDKKFVTGQAVNNTRKKNLCVQRKNLYVRPINLNKDSHNSSKPPIPTQTPTGDNLLFL
jgi:hypothetical protein